MGTVGSVVEVTGAILHIAETVSTHFAELLCASSPIRAKTATVPRWARSNAAAYQGESD